MAKKVVDLSKQELTEFPVFSQEELEQLVELNLSHNSIASIPPEIRHCSRLKVLNLNNNQLTSLPSELSRCRALIELHLQGNQLSTLPLTLGSLPQLKTLMLHDNPIHKVPDAIWALVSLERLYLSGCPITDFPLASGELTNLRELGVEKCGLTQLPEGIGHLKRLTQLFARHNALRRIPSTMRELQSLQFLYVDANTALPLPDPYRPDKPRGIIEHILQHQEPAPPPPLQTNKASLFRDMQMQSLLSQYDTELQQALQERGIDGEFFDTSEQIDAQTTVAFAIVPYDTHRKPGEIFRVLETCKARNIRYYILIQSKESATGDQMNLPIMEQVLQVHERLRREHNAHILEYGALEELVELIFKGLRQHIPTIKLQSIELYNIGHFSHMKAFFDPYFTCFEGENGTGKTTILRAIALALIGHDHRKIERQKLLSLLRILALQEDGQLTLEEGHIELMYTIDGESHTNTIMLHPIDDGWDVAFASEGPFAALSGPYSLKSLVVGFAQARGEISSQPTDAISLKKHTGAHIDDLLPLINNVDDQRLHSFASWISNLNNEANRKEKGKPDLEAEERKVLAKVFEIISEVTGHETRFLMVRQSSPPDIWVSTHDAPNGISLQLISQGFKVMIGWVGYFLQRLSQAFPLSSQFTEESAIVLIDEIDSYLHPKWQANMLPALRKHFPNTQFIASTHSPLMLGTLEPQNIYMLDFADREVRCTKPTINPYGAEMNRVLKFVMDQEDRALPGIHKMLEEYLELVTKGEFEAAKERQAQLRQLIDPEDPELLKIDAMMRTKELLAR